MSYELTKLPEGWEWASLDLLATLIQYGSSAKTSEEANGIPVLRMGNIANGEINYSNLKYLPENHNEFPALLLKAGDILFNRTNSSELVGKTAVFRNQVIPYSFASYLIRIRLNGCYPELFSWYLNSVFGRAWISSVVSQQVGQANVSGAKLKNLKIPLPPLNEQRRIVAKIEELKERTQRAKEALEAIPALLEQFRQSVLGAAFRGDLTADWREENPDVEPASVLLERTSHSLNLNFHKETNNINRDQQIIPNTWSWTPLKLVVKNIQAGKNFSCPEIPVTEDKVGLVKISAVTWGFFDEKETKTVTDESKIEPSLFINEGDFLISRANTLELVGASVVVEEIRHKIMISDKVWRVTFLEAENNYINFYLKSKLGRKEIESRATGNQLSMRNISQNAFKDVVIAIPPLIEQKEIIYRVKYFYKIADAIEYQYQEIKANLGLLDQSILGKAFRGELVPQDPNDEPASVLLERIRAEYAKLKTKTDKKSTARTSTRRTKNTQMQEEEPV
jgi:type I restriction enzyme S subunit